MSNPITITSSESESASSDEDAFDQGLLLPPKRKSTAIKHRASISYPLGHSPKFALLKDQEEDPELRNAANGGQMKEIKTLKQLIISRSLFEVFEEDLITTPEYVILKKRKEPKKLPKKIVNDKTLLPKSTKMLQQRKIGAKRGSTLLMSDQLLVLSEICGTDQKQSDIKLKEFKPEEKKDSQLQEVNLKSLGGDVCLCQKLNQSCWTLQRYKLALQFFKTEMMQTRQALENAKLFQNLVIHDLRNPTSQINYSTMLLLQQMQDNRDKLRQEFETQQAEMTALKDRLVYRLQEMDEIHKYKIETLVKTVRARDEELEAKEEEIRSLKYDLRVNAEKMNELFALFNSEPSSNQELCADIFALKEEVGQLLHRSGNLSNAEQTKVLDIVYQLSKLGQGLQGQGIEAAFEEDEFNLSQEENEQPLLTQLQTLNMNQSKFFENLTCTSMLDDYFRQSERKNALDKELKAFDYLWTEQTKVMGEALQKVDERSEEMLGSCHTSSIMLLNLINDLLDLAKHEKHTFQLDQSYFNLVQTVENTFSTLQFLKKRKNVKLELVIDPQDRRYFEAIYGDYNRYTQILINFVSNALKFSRENGVVQVHLKVLQVQVSKKRPGRLKNGFRRISLKERESKKTCYLSFEIMIRDNGLGISEEGLGKLFLNFSSLKEHHKGNFRGTGLGLSICKKIITKMGGNVAVESKLNEGTTFKIQITSRCSPLVEPDSALNRSDIPLNEQHTTSLASEFNSERKHGPTSSEVRGVVESNDALHLRKSPSLEEVVDRTESDQLMDSHLKQMKVLLVNDEETILIVLESIFSSFKFRPGNICKAINGLEAYHCAIQGDFDLIVMDLNMPLMDGLQACRQIKDYYADESLFAAASADVTPKKFHNDDSLSFDSSASPTKKTENQSMMRKAPYIVSLSASDYTPSLLNQCREAGFDDFFTVPLRLSDIREKILDKLLLKKTIFNLPTKIESFS